MQGNSVTSYLSILLTVVITVYSQLIIKWQVLKARDLLSTGLDKVSFIINLLLNPWVISAFIAAFLASLSWMGAMTKFELSYAYPVFISLTFILILIFSAILFREVITLSKLVATALIISGIIVGSYR